VETSRELERARRAELAGWLAVLFGVLVALHQTNLALIVDDGQRGLVWASGVVTLSTIAWAGVLARRGHGATAGVLLSAAAAVAILVGERLVGVGPIVTLLAPTLLAVTWTASARASAVYTIVQAVFAAAFLSPWPEALPERSLILVATAAQAFVGATASLGVASAERMFGELERRRRRLEAAEFTAARARAADEAKSGFLAAMSHELRTPLNAVLGYAELVSEEVEHVAPHALPDLDRIVRAGQHLRRLIDDVLDLSKIEAGRMTVLREPFAVEEVVSDVVQTTRSLVEVRHNRLESMVTEGLTVIGDRQRLHQILLNLIGNSAKFTREGRIWLWAVEDEGRVAVVVGDDGKGMTTDELASAFEKFGQADDPSVPEGGTGLGLPIALELTAAMGGHLVATSEPGRGTEIMLRLPMQQPEHLSLLAPREATREARRTGGLQ